MYECYNYSTLKIKSDKADSVAVKGTQSAVKLYDVVDGVAVIDTSEYEAGNYIIQLFSGDEVIQQDSLNVKQNLKYVDAEYDPRSKAEKILEAIEAYLGGVASHQQRRIKVGDKEIEYSSFDELMKWKNYYQQEVRKEQGKASKLRFEKLYYRGV